jgi:oxygen-independent coproporphyrinogen-3 oxidase
MSLLQDKKMKLSPSELIAKYNRPVPRYTSYPPVPFWSHAPAESEWIEHIKKSYDPENGVDLYVHVPFCESLCYYCGCNRTITKNHQVEENYLQLVLKEWALYKKKLGFTPMINSLHFGGGTPTFLSPSNLSRLILALLEKKSKTFIGSVEIDPRTVKPGHFEVFKKHEISRVSMGIQDFDVNVQRSINRMQSPELVFKLTDELRSLGFDSINFDLIYGLPNQTVQTITDTFRIVEEMRPDLIAFYSYAHLPDKIKNQKLIKENELPTPEIKRELYETGKKILEQSGYVEIGMDHFARPGSSLHRALIAKNLHRNFMGYVDKKSNILIGLGPTSISDSSQSFVQNAKDNENYSRLLDEDKLPFTTGHTHSKEDLIVQELILELMCHKEMDLSLKEQIPFWKEIQNELLDFKEDGILIISEDKLEIKNDGRGFLRNVALLFDFHYRSKVSTAKFSQSV